MTSPAKQFSAGWARQVLLDAITFYQKSLMSLREYSPERAQSIRAGSKNFEAQFEFYDLRGWPESLEVLRKECAHLQGRLERALDGCFPGLRHESSDDSDWPNPPIHAANRWK